MISEKLKVRSPAKLGKTKNEWIIYFIDYRNITIGFDETNSNAIHFSHIHFSLFTIS